MIDLIFVVAIGLCLGIIAGILPGLGTGGLLGLLFLALVYLDPFYVLILFLCILTSAQYFGSTIAILSGVPGDPASIPASRWGFELAKQGYGAQLLYSTAKYSLLSGVISFAIFLLIVFTQAYSATSLSAKYQSIVLLVALVSVALISNNRWYINVPLTATGLLIGTVGYSVNYQDYFFTFGNHNLDFGIPWLAILIGIMAIPGGVSLLKLKEKIQVSGNLDYTPTQGHSWTAIRGGTLGFIIGLIPGLSYILSSLMAAKLEQQISQDPFRTVIAAESANNAGAVSVLLPLLVLGIPITAAESIVFNVLTMHSSVTRISSIFIDNWIIFSLCFLIINVVLFVLAWKFSTRICSWVFNHTTIFGSIALVVSILSVVWMGINDNRLWVYVLATALSAIAALSWRKIDWSPLVFALLLQEHIESSFYTIQQLYF